MIGTRFLRTTLVFRSYCFNTWQYLHIGRDTLLEKVNLHQRDSIIISHLLTLCLREKTLARKVVWRLTISRESQITASENKSVETVWRGVKWQRRHECSVGNHLVSRSLVSRLACWILLCWLVRVFVADWSLRRCHQGRHRAPYEGCNVTVRGRKAYGRG